MQTILNSDPKENKILNEQEQNEPVNDSGDNIPNELGNNAPDQQDAARTKEKLEKDLGMDEKGKAEK